MDNRKCPTFDDIERYALDSEIDGSLEVEKHLEECPYCRLVVDQFRGDLDNLRRRWNEEKMPKVFHLTIMAIDEISGESNSTLLAAQSEAETADITAVTLSSPDQKLLIRAIRDMNTKDIWLYLLADELESSANILVKPFGLEKEFLTDIDGRINLGKIDWPSPELLNAEVRLPSATFKLTPVERLIDREGVAVLESAGGDRIKVTLIGEGRNRQLQIELLDMQGVDKDVPLKIAIRDVPDGKITQIKPAAVNRTEFDDIGIDKGLEIFLYQ